MLELMLVLAILLVIASLSWPRVTSMFERHRLREAAEDVRLHMAGCRLRALNEGVIYQFSFEPGGQSYGITPLIHDDAGGSATSGNAGLSGKLPGSMLFQLPPGAESNHSSIPVNGADLNSGTTYSVQGAASTSSTSMVPILFLPDGTADETSLDVVDAKRRRIRLSIRGLTSAVSLADRGKEGTL